MKQHNNLDRGQDILDNIYLRVRNHTRLSGEVPKYIFMARSLFSDVCQTIRVRNGRDFYRDAADQRNFLFGVEVMLVSGCDPEFLFIS